MDMSENKKEKTKKTKVGDLTKKSLRSPYFIIVGIVLAFYSVSLFIPLIWGLTVGEESLGPVRVIALIILLCAIILTNADKIFGKKEAKKTVKKSTARKNAKPEKQ